jgi:phenylacetate-coenzyme A ligase PaaK-like adenylate-forming protein
LTAVEGQCSCGCQFQRIKDVEGRREEMLYTITPDGTRFEVHAPRFWFHLVRVPGIRNYQFAQLPEGIAICIVPDPSHDAGVVKAAVEQIARMALDDLGARNGQLEVHIVDEIRRTGASAKQKLVAT